MRFPSWLMWYKKPEYRDIKEYSTAVQSGRRQLSPDGRGKLSIPSRLKLERILENKTCSPMSLYDFYMYLKYIEFSAENLEFYVWYKNYEASWLKHGGGDKDGDSLRSVPSSTSSEAQFGEKDHTITTSSNYATDPDTAQETLDRIAQLISTEAICGINPSSPCNAALRPSLPSRARSMIKPPTPPSSNPPPPSTLQGNGISTLRSGPSLTNSQAELQAVIETFLLPHSPKELNIPASVREQALAGLLLQTPGSSLPDPSHLKPVADHVYGLLRNCSHRNFVRLGVSNGTFETVCAATGLGIFLTLLGFLIMFVRMFRPFVGANSRWEVFAIWPVWWLGVSLILSGLRGSCFFLLLFSRRQPLPWERFDDDVSVASSGVNKKGRNGVMKVLGRLMIFDRKFKVMDENLRRLQRKIVVQSLIGGAVFATVAVVVFVFLPVWQGV